MKFVDLILELNKRKVPRIIKVLHRNNQFDFTSTPPSFEVKIVFQQQAN